MKNGKDIILGIIKVIIGSGIIIWASILIFIITLYLI